MTSKIIAITNQKGGVGKTTTAINLSASLSANKKKILLIDLDPQGNATTGSGINKQNIEYTIADTLLNLVQVYETITKTSAGFDLIPANSLLTATEVQLTRLNKREYFLRNTLGIIENNYDFIFIDCPPTLNILTLNALVACESVIIPVQCEYYALEGLASLATTIYRLKNNVNSKLEIEGLLRTMYDGRNRLALEVSKQLIQHFPGKVYDTVIPRNVRLAEAPSHGLSAIQYDIHSQGAIAYVELAEEFCKKAIFSH